MSELINSCLSPTIFSLVALEKNRTSNIWCTQKDSRECFPKLGVNQNISHNWCVIQNAEMLINTGVSIRLLMESRSTAS
ncbi:MAG TPA: hypothetical protein DCQ47_06555 [Gammaproteobacteria bacterium]|nr:hypothetical protein [Gammaproteobacteria bacterium]